MPAPAHALSARKELASGGRIRQIRGMPLPSCFRAAALLCGLLAAQISSAAQASLTAGVGRADITPDPAVLNWVTGQPYGEILDRLFVRALVLGEGTERVVLLTWDLVDAGESAVHEVRTALAAALNIAPDRILVNASHTHSAPWAPVYENGFRGRERDTWWAIRRMPPQNDEPHFRAWMQQLIARSVEAAREAAESARPASLWVGRVFVGDYLYNRRPRRPEWGVAESTVPAGWGAAHRDWDPYVLLQGATFGPMDPALTLLSLRDAEGGTIASLFHLACHAVSIYPTYNGISADWPGAAAEQISSLLGGEALFLQGTAGDITPWRRGQEAVAVMAAGLGERAQAAARASVRLETGPLKAGRAGLGLPLTPAGRERTGLDAVAAEVQVIACGPLALVTLPGEPLTDLGTEIRRRSPFPQTLVLGYSNGNGVHYVGMPGEKARGGYEMGVAGAGTDEVGLMLVETAVRLLGELYEQSESP